MFKFPTTTSNTYPVYMFILIQLWSMGNIQVYMFQFLVLSSSSTQVHWTLADGYQTQKCDCPIGFQHGHTNNNVMSFP
jgi:hypothetical protein